MNSRKPIVYMMMAIAVLVHCRQFAEAAESKWEEVDPPICLSGGGSQKDNAKAAVKYMNHLNFVVAKLGDMNDLLVLSQEYENLTDDNLNLASINDETTVQLIVQLMDALKDLMKSNLKVLRAQAAFEREKREAIWKALPSPAVFVATANPISLALAVGGAALTSVQNYQNAKAAAKGKFDDKLFEAGSEKLDVINEINKELFFSQWRLMRDYKIADSERITRGDASLFLGFADLLDGFGAKDFNSNKLVYDVFKSYEKEMGGIAFYWITRAAAANVIGNKEDVFESCGKYFSLYRNAPIVRRDMNACAMALLYVSSMMELKGIGIDKEQVIKWLQFVENTVRIPEWQTKFAVAMLYRKIDEDEKAKALLTKTLNEVYACLRVYEKSDGKKNIFRKTPALEVAFKNRNEGEGTDWKKGWPDWEKDMMRLVPYDGYIWLSGALYDMGGKDVYDRMGGLDKTRIGISENYITGRFKSSLPKISKSKTWRGVVEFTVRASGCWSEKDELKVLDVNKNILAEGGKEEVKFKESDISSDNKVVYLSLRTEYGFNVVYEFRLANDKNKPTKVSITFPWSKESVEYRP